MVDYLIQPNERILPNEEVTFYDMLPDTSCFLRYSVGDTPTSFLKTLIKLVLLLKPESSAMANIFLFPEPEMSCDFASSTLNLFIRSE